jgi:hypothetical protein
VLTLGQLPVGPCDALELRKRVYQRIKAAEAGRPSAVHRRDGWRARVESVRKALQDSREGPRARAFSAAADGLGLLGVNERGSDRPWRDDSPRRVGRDRKYVVAFISSGSPHEPLVEFVAADDYEQTRELVAVIRGSDGARRIYAAGDTLPALCTERFRTEIYNERIIHPGAVNKLVMVAREDDDEAILNHALIQSRRRYRT